MATLTGHWPTRQLTIESVQDALRTLAKDVPTLVVSLLQDVKKDTRELLRALATAEVEWCSGPHR